MRVKIKKGNHYSCTPISFPKYISGKNATVVAKEFIFTESCIYDLKDEDQGDVNKLFGFSIGWHHKTSFRFGWRADLKTRTIEIVGYEYHDKVRQPTMHICNVEIDKPTYFLLRYSPDGETEYSVNQNQIDVTVKNTVIINRKYGLGYTLGFYFGGNEVAPQDIIAYRKTIRNV